MATTSTEPERQREHHAFYMAMAALLLALSVGGFGTSYLLPASAGANVGPAVIHLHAFFGFSWLLLFLIQTALIATNRSTAHQALGLFGIALATAFVFTGIMVATRTMQVGVELGLTNPAKTFAVFPITIMVLFAGFFAAAVANIRRPALHRRLMLIASIMTMPPAAGRVLGQLVLEDDLPRQIMGAAPVSLAGGTIASLSADVLLLTAIVCDWRMRGRPHPVYLYSLAIILSVQIARLPLSQTSAWRSAMDVLLSL